MSADEKMLNQEVPLVMSVRELAEILHIGRNSAYMLVNSGDIRVVRIGKTIRVPRKALNEYLDRAKAIA